VRVDTRNVHQLPQAAIVTATPTMPPPRANEGKIAAQRTALMTARILRMFRVRSHWKL
jgi:hypothetical protein